LKTCLKWIYKKYQLEIEIIGTDIWIFVHVARGCRCYGPTYENPRWRLRPELICEFPAAIPIVSGGAQSTERMPDTA